MYIGDDKSFTGTCDGIVTLLSFISKEQVWVGKGKKGREERKRKNKNKKEK